MPGFEYAGSKLPKGVDRYKILIKINGVFYHKNTTNLFSTIGNFFGGNFIEHKRYSPTEEGINDLIRVGAELQLSGIAIKKVGKALFKTYRSFGNSIWKMPSYTERGFIYEAMRGGNLVRTFPVIDKFVKGVATSIKTLDLKAKSYLKPNAIFNKLKGYIDKLDDFKGATKGGVEIREEMVRKKILDLGIPKGATKDQVRQIYKARKYAEKKGIKLITTVVK